MIKLTIKPFDVLFFGSGKPFNMGDVAESIFPPHPTTFAGAVCSKISTHTNDNVSNILKAVYGPFLELNGELLLPKPCNIYSEKKKASDKLFILKPEKDKDFALFKYENTNKPNIKMLPIYRGVEEIEGFSGFIKLKGLKEFLKGSISNSDIVRYWEVFKYDTRVGIKIDKYLNSVGGGEDALYRIKYLNLENGCSFVFWVDFKDEKYEEILLNENPKSLKLGGEMKSVKYKAEKIDFREFFLESLGLDGNKKLDLKKDNEVMFLFLSYGVFEGNDFVPNIDGFKIISMCIDGYTILGINSKSRGRKTVKAMPPGTVIWAKCEKDIAVEKLGFLVKNKNGYEVKDIAGDQEFIGTNLVLVVKYKEG